MNHTAIENLEDIPYIGKSIAADLRAIGILHPDQLARLDPLDTYLALSAQMAHRHDPCVLYVLMAAEHYLASGVSIAWWKFTERGKARLKDATNQVVLSAPGNAASSDEAAVLAEQVKIQV